MWAVCTRCEPSDDIEIMRKSWGSKVDPLLADPDRAVQQPRAHRRLSPVREAGHVSPRGAVEPCSCARGGGQMEGSLCRSAVSAARNRDSVRGGRREGARMSAVSTISGRLLLRSGQVLAPHTFGMMLVGIAIGLVVGHSARAWRRGHARDDAAVRVSDGRDFGVRVSARDARGDCHDGRHYVGAFRDSGRGDLRRDRPGRLSDDQAWRGWSSSRRGTLLVACRRARRRGGAGRFQSRSFGPLSCCWVHQNSSCSPCSG